MLALYGPHCEMIGGGSFAQVAFGVLKDPLFSQNNISSM